MYIRTQYVHVHVYIISSLVVFLNIHWCKYLTSAPNITCSGNLMTKSLNDIVDEKDVVVGSEYMQTLVVVVPKSLYKEWEKSYERLTEMVVPRCSKYVCLLSCSMHLH